jgi:hypothetical protein
MMKPMQPSRVRKDGPSQERAEKIPLPYLTFFLDYMSHKIYTFVSCFTS